MTVRIVPMTHEYVSELCFLEEALICILFRWLEQTDRYSVSETIFMPIQNCTD